MEHRDRRAALAEVQALVAGKRAVLFDLFHTLVEVQPEGPAQIGTAELLGVDRRAWSAKLWEDTHDRLVGAVRDPREIVRRLAHAIDPSISEERIAQAAASRLRRFALALRAPPAASLQALAGLRAAHKRIGLVSNADVTEVAAWGESPLAPCFDAAIFSCDVGEKKPDARIYQIALERLGVEAADAVFVGDGGSDELRGARAVGLSAVMMRGIIGRSYPELVAARLVDADHVIDALTELLAPAG